MKTLFNDQEVQINVDGRLKECIALSPSINIYKSPYAREFYIVKE